MKKSYFLKAGFMILAAIFAVQSLAAQSFRVSGTVVDDSNLPLPGVTVLAQGTTTGVVTGLNGEYTITVDQNATLEFSFVGYESVESPVAGQSTINVVLREDVMRLDEVVVVGYGVQKKSHLTGSVASVSTEGMADVPVSQLDQALQGKSAGLTIMNPTSEAGATATIRVRGMGSISAGSEPLIVVDGFPVEGGLEMVNAGDVESIEILKDAASASIYGSRAAGGVILITTKAGNADAPSYNIKVTGGIKYIYEELDKYTMSEYYEVRQGHKEIYDRWANANGEEEMNLDWERACVWMENEFGSTDWQDLALNTPAYIATIQASVSGGTDKVKYYVSGNYSYDEGTMKTSEYQRLGMRAKVDVALSDHVDFGISLAPQYTMRQYASTSYNNFVRYQSWFPAYHTEETIAFVQSTNPEFSKMPGDLTQAYDFGNLIFYYDDGTYYERSSYMWSTSDSTPIDIMESIEEKKHTYTLNANAYLNVRITDDLFFRSSNGVYLSYYNHDRFREEGALKVGDPAEGYYETGLYTDLLTENMLTYMKTFGKHDFNLLAGYTADLSKYREAAIKGNFEGDYVPTLNAASSLILTDTYTVSETTAMESYLARLTYSYDDKYLVSASWRADGSSRFGAEDRYGYFPSVSFGWRITEENFMQNADWIDQLKFRASYGVTGNNSITNYAAYNTVALVQYVTGADNIVTGYANTDTTQANEGITWEQTNEFNVGLDLAFLGGNLAFVIDAYRSQTQSLLMEQSISSITGYTGYWNNIGKIRNTGIEFEVTSLNFRTADFTWTTSFNIAHNKNEVVDLGGLDQIYSLGERNEIYRAKVGEESIQFWGWVQDPDHGVYLTDEEVDADTSVESTYKDAGGLKVLNNGDGTLDDDDRAVIGSPFPDFTWGMTNSFTYKNFDMSFTWQGSQGAEIINGDMNYGENKRYVKAFVENRWIAQSEEGWGDGMTPTSTSSGVNWMMTDYAVEDASYAALRDLTIGYTLPSHISSKFGLKSLRLYASGQNLLFIWTKDFRMVNPEGRMTSDDSYNRITGTNNPYDNPLIDGYSRGNFPLQTTYSLGIDISF